MSINFFFTKSLQVQGDFRSFISLSSFGHPQLFSFWCFKKGGSKEKEQRFKRDYREWKEIWTSEYSDSELAFRNGFYAAQSQLF